MHLHARCYPLRSAAVLSSVRVECNNLGTTSLHCQNALQQRGVDKATAMSQCQSTIDAYKECNNRKSQIDSRRGWWELKQKQLRDTANA